MRYYLFRFMVVFQYGGIYLDMDVNLTKPLIPLLDHSCAFPYEEHISSDLCEQQRPYGRWPWPEINCSISFPQIGNFAFGAGKHHLFLKSFISDFAVNWIDKTYSRQYNDVFMLTSIGSDAISHFHHKSMHFLAAPNEVSKYWAAKNCTIIYASESKEKFHFGKFGTHNRSPRDKLPYELYNKKI